MSTWLQKQHQLLKTFLKGSSVWPVAFALAWSRLHWPCPTAVFPCSLCDLSFRIRITITTFRAGEPLRDHCFHIFHSTSSHDSIDGGTVPQGHTVHNWQESKLGYLASQIIHLSYHTCLQENNQHLPPAQGTTGASRWWWSVQMGTTWLKGPGWPWIEPQTAMNHRASWFPQQNVISGRYPTPDGIFLLARALIPAWKHAYHDPMLLPG